MLAIDLQHAANDATRFHSWGRGKDLGFAKLNFASADFGMQGGSLDAAIVAAHSYADWRRVAQSYGQFSTIASDPERANFIPDAVAGAVAESLGRVLAHYDGREEVFLDDLLAIWSGIDYLTGSHQDRFHTLYLDKRLES